MNHRRAGILAVLVAASLQGQSGIAPAQSIGIDGATQHADGIKSMPERMIDVREVQTRIFVAPEAFRATLAFYKSLTGGRVSLHFPFPERGLELAAISSPAASFLIIAGEATALAPFRATSLTVLVGDIAAVAPQFVPLGATVLQPPTPVPTGFQMRLRHPDGLIVEYVQHTAAADRFRDPDL